MGKPGNADQLQVALAAVKSAASLGGPMSRHQEELLKWARNVDKGYAWVVLAALWFMMTATLGPYRMYGLIFAEVTTRGVYSREAASWPVSCIFSVENMAGPLVSVLVYHVSFRWSMLIGHSLLVLGNGLAGLSDSLALDVLLIGVVQGVGYSFIFMPFMEIINSYFLRYRNVALGLALSGGTTSVFLLSPLTQWVLDSFPWRSAYFALSLVCALNLLMVPFLRPNPRPQLAGKPAGEPAGEPGERRSTLSRVSLRALTYQNSQRRQSTILVARRAPQRQASVVSVNPFASSAGLERKISRAINDQRQPAAAAAGKLAGQPDTLSLDELGQEPEASLDCALIGSILKTPAFHMIWYNELLYYCLFSIYSLVMVDYGIDRGCTKDQAESLLNYFSLGELLGRLGLTALVDMHFLSIRSVVIIDLLALGGCLLAVTQVSGFVWMAALTAALSAVASLLYILLNGLLVGALGERQVTIGYGMASCIGGLLMSLRPLAVGYFRDQLGTYDPLMATLAAACFFGALLWLLEPLVTRLLGKAPAPEPAP